ncbi:TPA: CapA family protein [Candidatus Poribacteria bacterium]|nr:MAG: hypothetical protein DRP09_13325 [Candidatus Thorarchaeota archaeon]HDO76390.1 CapA family protein [Candidatus Poribacteria bacterium]HEX29995.1 CapA family protein [Candidatus Poribacteria bacterium]
MMTLYAVGDIILSGKAEVLASQRGWKFLFQHVAETLRKGDIVFGNLDSPLSKSGSPNPEKPQGSPHLRAAPDAVEGLKYAGFNVISLANNHAMDYGVEALTDTLDVLDKSGIRHVGAGEDEDEARKPTIFEDKEVSVALLAYTYTYPATSKSAGCAVIKERKIREDIEKIKERADVITVSLHHGICYSDYPVPSHIELAHRIIEWGAHLILGHHPHVLQGIERYKHGIIAYSLGNFITDLSDLEARKKALDSSLLAQSGKFHFDAQNDTRPAEGLILRCLLGKDGVDDLKLIPIHINDGYQPVISTGEKRENILSRIEKLSLDLQNRDLPVWKTLEELQNRERIRAAIGKGFLANLKRIHRIRRSHLSLLWSYLSDRISLKS